jgi:hypothetical protein
VPRESMNRRKLLAAGATGGVLSSFAFALLREPHPASAQPAAPPSARPAALRDAPPAAAGGSPLPAPDPLVFLVNRITFGMSPADLARAREIGGPAFVDEQLFPEQIDDSALDAELAGRFSTLQMDIGSLLALDRQLVANELVHATLLRAFYSRRQLFELVADFWSNHFNIYHYGKECEWFKTPDDRDVVRRFALGSFGDLLMASAKSPAMLLYLDNAASTKAGPNENYARELMELHTLGVGAGYTQQDVQEVARSFTGWTIYPNGPLRGQFRFDPSRHDDRARLVLGNSLPAGLGIGHGERVLEILAAHPATATHLATKLCTRFVADSPPASVVAAAAQTFTASGGDLRAVVRTILTSSEFAAAADQKLRRPFELMAAAVRALDAVVGTRGLRTLTGSLSLLGQLPFNWSPPNGYPDASGAWASTGGMLSRWNFGIALGGNGLRGVRADLTPPASQPQALVDALSERLLARPLLPADRAQLIGWVGGGHPGRPLPAGELPAKVRGLVALLLDSPYFQWR